MINDQVKAKGRVQIFRRNRLTNTVSSWSYCNLITTKGMELFANLLIGTSTPASHISIGTGTSAPTLTDTTLTAEIRRVAITSSTNGSQSIFRGVFPAGVAGTFTEAGLHNAASAGTLISHVIFNPINLTIDDEITVVWSVTFDR